MGDADEILVARVLLEDDERAFGRLVEAHQSPVRNFLLRLTRGNSALADDLAQDTFLIAYRKIGAFRGEGSFRSWLMRIAYTNFLQEIRKKRSETRLVDEEMAGIEDSFQVVSQIDERARAARLDVEVAIRALSTEERAVITMCFSLGMSHSEASHATGMPLGTVKSHIARAKAKLRVELRHWDPQVDTGKYLRKGSKVAI